MEYVFAGSIAFTTHEIPTTLVALDAVLVIHCDIMCANVPVSKTGGIALCDFGPAASARHE